MPTVRGSARVAPTWASGAATAVGLLYGFGGVGCLLGAWFPMGPHTPIRLSETLGVVGLTMAPVLISLRRHITPAGLNGALGLITALLSVLVACTGSAVGVVLTGVCYMCIALIAAYFLPPVHARGHAVSTVGGFSAGVLISGVPNLVVPWFLISSFVVGASALLCHVVAQLRQQAALDPLTGLANRAYFRLAAERELALAARGRARFSLVLLDLDDFKAVNDTYGHVAGDALLADLAAAWQSELRQGDLLARYGGDEFAIIVADANRDDAMRVLDRLRGAHRASWSAGIATWDDDADLNQLLQRADRDLYRAKDARVEQGNDRSFAGR